MVRAWMVSVFGLACKQGTLFLAVYSFNYIVYSLVSLARILMVDYLAMSSIVSFISSFHRLTCPAEPTKKIVL
jgi:hypothetical protein